MSKFISVNFHMFKPCDAKCTFCFATFRDLDGFLPEPDARKLLDALAKAGAQKINFAGGEPTLHPFVDRLIRHAKSIGLTTSIVTNGSKLERVLDRADGALDWVTLSVDTADEGIQAALGRGTGNHVRRALRLAQVSKDAGARLKLNSVITRLNADEDMSDYVRQFAPERWKLFQVLPVDGQNNGSVEPLLVTSEQFTGFVERHLHLVDYGINVVPESNDAMTDSYAMIDPLGRFYGNTDGKHVVSAPILEVGVARALAQVGFEHTRLVERGGVYAW